MAGIGHRLARTVACATAIALAPVVAAPADAAGRAGQRQTGPPNVVLITSDDQSLSDLRWMPRTRRVLGRSGVTLRSMLSPHPLCCPARANLLTGQYAQNSGVRSNSAALLGGFRNLARRHTLATWLQQAGYRTAFVGKYLNGYSQFLGRIGDEPDGRQPGWSQWNPLIEKVDTYFGATFYDNGHRRTFRQMHSSDVINRYTRQYIRRFAGSDDPFFIWASHYAPHGTCVGEGPTCWRPPEPARRHASLFSRAQSPSLGDPAFNERDLSDKPPLLRRTDVVPVAVVQRNFLARIRSLQAVDEAVADAVRSLRRAGELDNTVIMFTSDNGFLMGQHRLMTKNLSYEPALRVPLLVRGPGIPRGQTRSQTVTMIDIAPTILAMAGSTADTVVDGRSMLPVLRSRRAPGNKTVLIQAGPMTRGQREPWGWSWRGVRTGRYTYVRWANDFEELYDRRADPAELQNVAGRRNYTQVLRDLRGTTVVLSDCSGQSCRRPDGLR